MLKPVYTTHFKRDVKRVSQRGYDMEKLKQVVDLLVREEKPLPARYKDHALKGRWKPHRELHIESDWLLVYSIEVMNVFLPEPAPTPIFFLCSCCMASSYCCAPTMRV